jgi:hypothetical protein
VATLHELCIKLCHFIWHKVVQEEHESADLILHTACLDLIRVGDSVIARKILQYVTKHTKISTDVMRIKFILLYATALKLSGEAGLACKELDSESWSVTEVKYRILVAAIKDDKETVFNLLDKAAKSGEVTLDDLRVWPAFGTLRGDLEFQDKVHKIYGKELIVGSNLSAASSEQLQAASM